MVRKPPIFSLRIRPPPPIAAFTTLPTPNATTTDTLIVCQGQPVQFLNQSENANAFMWEFGNGTTSTTANPSYTYPEPGTYEVTLTAYSNFPQPDVCEADAGEWVWGNVVGYTQNPDYVNIVVVSYENTVVQTFMMPLSLVDQQTIVNYYYQGIFNGAFYSVYSISYKPEEENPVIDFFNISSCMDIDTLTFCGYLQENVTTYLDEITGVYNTEIEVCKIPPVITYLKLTASDDSGVVVTDYGIFDNNCFAITIPNTQPGEVYELLIQECFNSICTDFFPSFICDTFITIPDTSPRPAQKDGESTASMVIVIEPGFAPQISCVATVCQGTIADYSTDADCETYLWEVSGGQILSGQGTPAISVEWTTPPLGSISLSAGCGEETCNQPTVAAVPVIGGTVTIEGQSNFCLNETLQYTAPYFGGTAYQWSIVPPSAGTILSGQGGNLITVQWGASAATLQLNYQNNLLNCGGSASLAVQPKPAFALNPVSPVCEGNSMSISANSMASFVWSVSGGEIISGQNSSQILLLCSASGSMTVSATPVNPNTFCNASAQTSFTVVPYPQTPATINGSTQICPLQTYTYSAAPLQPNTQFIWTVTGGTIIAGQNSPTVQVQWNDSVPNSLSVVRQTLTSPVCTSLPATLSVSTIDDATFTISGATTVCPNSQPTYLITPILPNATYTWSVIPSDEVELVQGQNSGTVSLLFGNSAAGTVTLSAAYCNIVATLPISIGAKPVPFITQTDTLCTGNSVQLSVSDLVGTEPYTGYLWKNSAGSAIGINPTTFITTEGVYSVQVTNTSGCVGLASHRVNQYTSPEAQAFVSSHVVCIQNPDDVDLIAIDGTNYAFMWIVNGSVISSANTPFLTHLGNDVEGSFVYRVLVTDTQNTCTKLSPPKTLTTFCVKREAVPAIQAIPLCRHRHPCNARLLPVISLILPSIPAPTTAIPLPSMPRHRVVSAVLR
ncbi:MAG: PKD domain-containing protein [Sphingobacteriales bacterium]|nr:MAG: PKD domain-containing protein [Sphingobacteriales bacterium]